MPIDKLDVENIYMIDPNTGERTELKGVADITVATEDISAYEPIVPYAGDTSFAMDVTVSDEFKEKFFPKKLTVKGSIEEIVREVFLNMPLGHEVVDLEFKQNRIHNKKRINKKWGKRHGYTCTVIYI
ncbi:hypothetical protein [Tissierella pigra]|uniref:Uncharacterized protein n=1 Tax=Tissierella pigra TaxID=2607614 RepID=A0A6N7XWT7_9FIRM|nr:hypothetical protein [Tissierella pigra]MSU01913.1 hypothetical protein [Tissierella pigra]